MSDRATRKVIYSSEDYDKFTFLNTNRDVNRGHVEKIKQSIEQHGNFTEKIPLVFNEKLQAIDGQHRFTALKELGLPVYYTVVEGFGIKQARAMNLLNKGWGMMDWAKSYANEGVTSYKNFLTLTEEYPDIAPGVVMQYALGNSSKGMYREFREGAMILPEQALKPARERLESLMECKELNGAFGSSAMQAALLVAMDVDGFSIKRMLKKIAEVRDVQVPLSLPDSLRVLEDVYNYKYTAQNRLRFF